MGNTDIALPTGSKDDAGDKTVGIPAVTAQQESRSVLGKENEISSSLFSLTVLPASGKCTSMLTANNKACKKPSKQVDGKCTVSWAQIASR